MSYFSLGISTLLAILAFAFAVLLLIAITSNLRTARWYRKNIGQHLSRLRLSRMLSFHRINRESYLHTQSIVDIKDQMQRCSNCTETERCDEVLEDDADTDTRFCNNDEKLQQLKNKLGSTP